MIRRFVTERRIFFALKSIQKKEWTMAFDYRNSASFRSFWKELFAYFCFIAILSSFCIIRSARIPSGFISFRKGSNRGGVCFYKSKKRMFLQSKGGKSPSIRNADDSARGHKKSRQVTRKVPANMLSGKSEQDLSRRRDDLLVS